MTLIVRSYSIHNGGTLLKCSCGFFFDIPKSQKFICSKCKKHYMKLNGYILRDYESEVTE